MRISAAALAASLVLALAAPGREASAGATVDLLFVGQNGAPIGLSSEARRPAREGGTGVASVASTA